MLNRCNSEKKKNPPNRRNTVITTYATGCTKYPASSLPAMVIEFRMSLGAPRPNLLQRFLAAAFQFVMLLGDRLQENILQRGAGRQRRNLLLQRDAAFVDDHDLVADLRDLGQDVRRQHHRP